MMGRTHALSGAAGWLAGCTALTTAGHPPRMSTVLVGSLVSAGCALLPDIDHPQSTIAHTLGPITRLAARGAAAVSSRARTASCEHCSRRRPAGGHRALTHTAVFAVAAGAVVALLGWLVGAPAGAATVWAATGLAARGMLTRRRGTLGAVLLASFVTLTAVVVVKPAAWWWLGLPVAWGTLAHSLGDAVTVYGAPLAWPLRIRGCRWARVGTPSWLRFRTGGPVERVVWVLLLVGSVAALGSAVAAS